MLQADERGQVINRWRGELVSGEFDGSRVVFRVESLLARALRRKIPSLVVSRSCQHRLFDAGCQLDRKTFTKIAAIVSMDGYKMTVDTALEEQWARGGELVHVASGERIEIVDQVGSDVSQRSVITLQAKPYNAHKGDEVEVLAGCDREIATCHDKFNNVVNFGGFPHLPTKNPFEWE